MSRETEIGARIKLRREELKMTQGELGDKLSLNKSTIQRYEAGVVAKIKLPIIQAIAQALDVDPNWLALKTDSMGRFTEIPQDDPSDLVRPDQGTCIPLLGKIACGDPILAEENVADRILLPSHVNASFALICTGDSMTGAGVEDGDIVFIRQQPQVENGEIAAVLIRDEATLKKVYLDDNRLTLLPMNPTHDPFVFVGKEMRDIRIIGKAVAVLKNLE